MTLYRILLIFLEIIYLVLFSRVEHDNTGFGPGWYLYKVRQRSRVKSISL